MIDEASFVPDLIRWEGAIAWMYRDTLGYVTVGIGNLIHDADMAYSLPFKFTADGEPAAPGNIQRAFLRVIAMPKAMPASAYRQPDGERVELDDDGISDLAISRLRREFLPGLARLCPGFYAFPAPAQKALVDMAWNVGLHGLEQFGHLLAAVDKRDWSGAAASCHRKGVRDARNEWCRDQFLAAA
jgi:GH24 family phage-related lysozyme (muramidase)